MNNKDSKEKIKIKKEEWFVIILKEQIVQNYLLICSIGWIVLSSYWISNTVLVQYLIIEIIVATLISIVTMIVIVKRVLTIIIKQEHSEMKAICRNCAQNSVKYEFASFDFYTLDQIVGFEKEMILDPNPSECLITIYTASLETEEADEIIRKAVKNNLKHGITYKIYYLRGIPTDKQIQLYGKENLIAYERTPEEDMELDLATEFDIIVFEKSNGIREGYFSLNFSTSIEPRPCSQGFKCENKCHYENDNLLYKKMRDDSTSLLLATLAEWEVKHQKKETTTV